MSTYVLIHGAWAGSWCWEKVVPLLQQAGHQVVAPDLPGHGQDRTPLGEITLAAYTSRVCEILDAQTEPVILVGHSMGGIVISQVAEVRPEQIATLVYLAAFLLQHGQTVSQIASVDTDSFLLPTLMVNQEQGYATFKEEAPLKEVLFADCSDEDAARARVRLGPQSLVPFVTPISTTVERFGRVPRVYIECLRDRVISPASQHRMYTALPCQHIISMQTSHSAFFSAPQELVSHLESLSETARVAKEVSDDESTGRARSHPDQTCHWTHAQGHRRGSPRDQAMAYGVPRSTMNESMDLEALAGEALRHLQALLRCNTTESEAAAIAYLREQLAAEGIDSRIIEPTPSRPSLWARLPGDGAKRPLLLLSHVDVVPVEREQWTMDPFGGGIRDGYIYGRGAIDMKGMLAKQLTLFLHFARCTRQPGQRLQRDLLLLSVADEEHGGTHGMQWIAEHEPGLFAPAEFALNEGGGFAFDLGSKRLYVCEVAQKGIAPVTLRARGTPGHGAVPHHGTSAIARLARAIGRVESGPLPLHMTAAMRQFVAAIAATQSPMQRAIVRQLGNPLFSQAVLRLMPNPNALRAMLRNTAVPTVIRAGEAINVVPGEATALLDGRLLPGQTGKMFAAELRRRIGDAQVEVQVEVGLLGYEQSAQTPLFSALEAAIAAHDPGALVVPYLFPAVSDARFLVPRGVITYGFDPMKPEPGWPAPQLLAHGHDERISVENVAFGLRVLYDAIKAL